MKQFFKILFLSLIWFSLLAENGNAQTENNLLIMKTYLKNKESKQATEYFKKLDKSVINKDLKAKLAESYYLENKTKQAIAIFLEINDKKRQKYALELAMCYAKLNQPDSVIIYLTSYLQQKNKKSISEIKSNSAFKTIEKSKLWIDFWKKDWYSQNDLIFNDALYENRIGNYSESIILLENIIKKRTQKSEVYWLLAKNYEALKENKEAIKMIDKALYLDTKRIDYIFKKSQLLAQIGKNKNALKLLNFAIKKDASEIDYHLLKVEIYLQIKKNKEAAEIMDSLLKFTHNLDIYAFAGKVFYENKDYLTALKYYNQAIENGANNPKLYIERGDTYVKTEALEFAEQDYSMALDFFPTNGSLFFKRGEVRKKLKKYEKAKTDFHKAKMYRFTK